MFHLNLSFLPSLRPLIYHISSYRRCLPYITNQSLTSNVHGSRSYLYTVISCIPNATFSTHSSSIPEGSCSSEFTLSFPTTFSRALFPKITADNLGVTMLSFGILFNFQSSFYHIIYYFLSRRIVQFDYL